VRSQSLVESLALPRPGRQRYAGDSDVFGLRAASAVLMDANSGAVLYQRSPDAVRSPASVTKILTALVILEHGQMTDTVTASSVAARTGGYRLGLRAGQRISLGDLLAAILIRSANDAAVAAAEHVGGSLGGFVALMNEKAADIGMANSRFSNPHGLDEPFHYTTARDMAALTRVALENPTFAELVRTRKPGSRSGSRHASASCRRRASSRATTGCWASSKGRTGSRPATRIPRAAAWWLPPAGEQPDDRRPAERPATLDGCSHAAGVWIRSIRDAARVQPDGSPWHPERAEGWTRLEAQARLEERP